MVKRVSVTATFAWLFSLLAVVSFLALVSFLVADSLPVLEREGCTFLRRADWSFRQLRFGAASMLYGTAVISAIAMAFALPLGLGSAILTSEYVTGHLRMLIKSAIELLAGIPSVVYGLLGVLFLRPLMFYLLRPWQPETGDNLLTAGLLLGVMVLPTLTSLSDDVFRSVSHEEREAASALGLTKYEVFVRAVFPKALPGLMCAGLLGLGRALGETIAVFLVIGRADNRLPKSWSSLRPLLESGQTLTSKLGGSELSIAYGNPEHWSAMIALGLLLLAVVGACVAAGEGLLLVWKRSQ